MEEASLLQRYGVNHPKLKAVRARINAFQVESGVETPLSRLRAEEVLLLETFGPEHPKVKEVRKRIAALDEPDPKKADLSSTDAPDVGAKVTIPVDLAAQRQELERLKERIDRRREEVRDLSEWNSLELSLVQDVETARRLSQTVPAPRPDVAVVRPPRGEYVKVLSEPQAGVPKSRSPWKALCLGSGAGALVGVVLIGASRDRISVANRAKPENLPVIRLPTPDVTLLHGGDGDAISPCFIVQHQPQSYEANTYRSLRTALRFGAGKGAGRSFAVLCTSPGDESRIIAVNLAASFALAGRRTLFIDALATGHSAVRLFADQVQVLETTDPGATICNRTANTRLPRLAVAEANPSLEAASIDDLARSAASLLQHYEVTIFFTNSPRKIAKLTPAGLHECTIVVAPYAQSVEKPADVLSSDAESLEESVIAIATFGSTLE